VPQFLREFHHRDTFNVRVSIRDLFVGHFVESETISFDTKPGPVYFATIVTRPSQRFGEARSIIPINEAARRLEMNAHFVKGVVVGLRIKMRAVSTSFTITDAAYARLEAFLRDADYPRHERRKRRVRRDRSQLMADRTDPGPSTP
jgi:hypothetical protein